jgi:hypothetical protein
VNRTLRSIVNLSVWAAKGSPFLRLSSWSSGRIQVVLLPLVRLLNCCEVTDSAAQGILQEEEDKEGFSLQVRIEQSTWRIERQHRQGDSVCQEVEFRVN